MGIGRKVRKERKKMIKQQKLLGTIGSCNCNCGNNGCNSMVCRPHVVGGTGIGVGVGIGVGIPVPPGLSQSLNAGASSTIGGRGGCCQANSQPPKGQGACNSHCIHDCCGGCERGPRGNRRSGQRGCLPCMESEAHYYCDQHKSIAARIPPTPNAIDADLQRSRFAEGLGKFLKSFPDDLYRSVAASSAMLIYDWVLSFDAYATARVTKLELLAYRILRMKKEVASTFRELIHCPSLIDPKNFKASKIRDKHSVLDDELVEYIAKLRALVRYYIQANLDTRQSLDKMESEWQTNGIMISDDLRLKLCDGSIKKEEKRRHRSQQVRAEQTALTDVNNIIRVKQNKVFNNLRLVSQEHQNAARRHDKFWRAFLYMKDHYSDVPSQLYGAMDDNIRQLEENIDESIIALNKYSNEVDKLRSKPCLEKLILNWNKAVMDDVFADDAAESDEIDS